MWIITFRRDELNKPRGYTVPSVNVPGGKEEDAKRIIVLIKALTSKEPYMVAIKIATLNNSNSLNNI